MNTIKVYLSSDGSVARVDKNFPLVQYQYQNVLLNVFVPTENLAPAFKVQNFVGQLSSESEITAGQLTAFVQYKLSRAPQANDVVYYVDNSTEPTKLYTAVYSNSQWTWEEVTYFATPQLNGTAVKVGSTAVTDKGKVVKSKRTYPMRFLKNVQVNGIEYAMFERKLPKEFTNYYGNANSMTVNVYNINEGAVYSLITSQAFTYEVLESTLLDQDEPIEPTAVEYINSVINEMQVELSGKQDHEVETLITETKTIDGAINELAERIGAGEGGLETLTERVETLEEQVEELDDFKVNQTIINQTVSMTLGSHTDSISELDTEVGNLKAIVGTGEHFVGSVTVTATPTDQTATNVVQAIESRSPKGGDVVLITHKIEGATDKVYKYIFNGTSWGHYEIPPIEKAGNFSAGIIEGTYRATAQNAGALVVDIVSGEIKEIYINRGNGVYNAVSTLLNSVANTVAGILDTNDETNIQVGKALKAVQDKLGRDITETYALKTNTITRQEYLDLISGTQAVGRAVKAVNDDLGRNIANTYQTQALGATKQYVKDYALPNEFNDVHYLNLATDMFQKEIPSSSKVVNATIGDTTLVNAIYQLQDVKFQLSKNNRYLSKYYVALNASEIVYFRLTTSVKKVGQAEQTISVELSDNISLQANTITAIEFSSHFADIETLVKLEEGDVIRQVLEIHRTTSTTRTVSVYSNSTYSSTFYLTTIAKTLYLSEGFVGEIKIIETQTPIEDSAKVVAQFTLDTDLTDDTQYIFVVPQANVAETKPFYLQLGDSIYEVKTPYSVNTALVSMLNQTKQADQNYRFLATFNGTDFHIEQSNLGDLVSLVELHYDGTNIYNGTQIMTFTDIQTLCLDKSKFVYLYYINAGVVLLPMAEDGSMIEFMNTYMLEGHTWSARIIINDLNQVKYDEYELANREDLVELETRIDENIQEFKADFTAFENKTNQDVIDLKAKDRLHDFEIANINAVIHDIEITDMPNIFPNLSQENHPTHIADESGKYHPVLPDGACEFVSVEGKSVVSENLLVMEDVPETTTGGITYSIHNGVINFNGTSTGGFVYIPINIPKGDYYLKKWTNYTTEYNSNIGFHKTQGTSVVSAIQNGAKYIRETEGGGTLSLSDDARYFAYYINNGVTITNGFLKPMLVRGTVAPTEFKQGFDGIKSVLAEGVQINGANLSSSTVGMFGLHGSYLSGNKNGLRSTLIKVKKNTTYSIVSVNKNFANLFVGLALTDNEQRNSDDNLRNISMMYNVWSKSMLQGKKISFNSGDYEYARIYLYSATEYTDTDLQCTLELGEIVYNDVYTPYKAPLYIPFTSVNRFAHTGNKTQGLFRASFENGKATLNGIATSSSTVFFGDETLKAGTYNYKIWNNYGQTVGIYDVTADDWCSTVSSRNILEGSFTLTQDSTIAMGVDIRSGQNYSGEEIRYMVTKNSYTIDEFVAGNPNEEFDKIELKSGGTTTDKIYLETREDGTFDIVSEKPTGKYTITGNERFTLFTNYGTPFIRIDFSFNANTSSGILGNFGEFKRLNPYGSTEDGIEYFYTEEGHAVYLIRNGNYTTSVENAKNWLVGKEFIYSLNSPIKTSLATGLTENQVAALIEKYGSVEVVGNTNEEFVKPDVTMLYQVTKAIES